MLKFSIFSLGFGSGLSYCTFFALHNGILVIKLHIFPSLPFPLHFFWLLNSQSELTDPTKSLFDKTEPETTVADEWKAADLKTWWFSPNETDVFGLKPTESVWWTTLGWSTPWTSLHYINIAYKKRKTSWRSLTLHSVVKGGGVGDFYIIHKFQKKVHFPKYWQTLVILAMYDVELAWSLGGSSYGRLFHIRYYSCGRKRDSLAKVRRLVRSLVSGRNGGFSREETLLHFTTHFSELSCQTW